MKFKASRMAAAMSILLLAPLAGMHPALAAEGQLARATPMDLGVAPAGDMKDIVIALKVPDRAALEAFVASTVDRSSANYGKFLTPAQFKARFGQSDAAIKRVSKVLAAHGITVGAVHANNLLISARASNAVLAKVFGSAIHAFSQDDEAWQAPLAAAAVPADVADVVAGVAGLSTKAVYHSHLKRIDKSGVQAKLVKSEKSRPAATKPTSGIPEQYDTVDFMNLYDGKPLRDAGIDGTGTTLGIMTFASFSATDVGTYWATVGGTSSTARITTVNTTGGAISSSGADETTLDIEQAGGIALGAKVIVYEAANTSAGELALYSRAINDNKADTLSISWGAAEVAEDPDALEALSALFLQAAAQGEPVTAASGDEGAYDLNYAGSYPYPSYSQVLSVDFPSSSPYVLAAGGTTLPVKLALSHGTVTVPAVRPWAWDYLSDYETTYNGTAYYITNLFPVGGGGGVSVQFPVPSYQAGLPGVQYSQPGQSMFCFSSPTARGTVKCTPGQDLIDFPSGYAGRNTPDVSLDADPETGYSLYYAKAWSIGSGGTSFVAPQLNGVFALLTQKKGGRLGWLHPQLYGAFKSHGYASTSPFTPVAAGDNEFWPATPSFNPATGLGQLDIAKLATVLAP